MNHDVETIWGKQLLCRSTIPYPHQKCSSSSFASVVKSGGIIGRFKNLLTLCCLVCGGGRVSEDDVTWMDGGWCHDSQSVRQCGMITRVDIY